MPLRPVKPRPAGTLKDAVTRLITACGGAAAASEVVRVRGTQLQRYMDPAEDGCHAPVDVVTALERLCGEPLVTAALAAASGCTLLPIEGADDPDTIHADHARMAEQVARIFAGYAGAMANDGRIDAREAGEMLAHVDHALALIGHLRTHLVVLAREGARQ